MLTPFFTASQDDEYVFVNVKIAHVRFQASALEMMVDGDLFVFSMPPYYLRLRFPAEIVDDERATARFVSEEGIVRILLPKNSRGQHFADLDLPAKLLARVNITESGRDDLMAISEKMSGALGAESLVQHNLDEAGDDCKALIPNTTRPLIEEVDVPQILNGAPLKTQEDLFEGEQHDWEIDQEAAIDPCQELKTPDANRYGFNNLYDKVIGISSASGNDINELSDPEMTPAPARVMERLIKENIKFDAEYYAADYIAAKYPTADDDKLFEPILKYKNPHSVAFSHWYRSQQLILSEPERQSIMPVEFLEQEQQQMLNLPRKSYLIEKAEKARLLGALVSILFAALFELRENCGEPTVESAWTVGKLIPQFAFLDADLCQTSGESLLRAAIFAGIRRALSYPYHRNYTLVMKVWDDVYFALRGGKRSVLRVLLATRELFRCHDVYYVYEIIWCRDLCAWVMGEGVSEQDIASLARDVRREYSAITKTEITFEKAADDDEIVALSLQEIEDMAEELFRAYQQGDTI